MFTIILLKLNLCFRSPFHDPFIDCDKVTKGVSSLSLSYDSIAVLAEWIDTSGQIDKEEMFRFYQSNPQKYKGKGLLSLTGCFGKYCIVLQDLRDNIVLGQNMVGACWGSSMMITPEKRLIPRKAVLSMLAQGERNTLIRRRSKNLWAGWSGQELQGWLRV